MNSKEKEVYTHVFKKQAEIHSEQNEVILKLKNENENLRQVLQNQTRLMLSYALLKDCSKVDVNYEKLKRCIQSLDAVDESLCTLLNCFYIKEGLYGR